MHGMNLRERLEFAMQHRGMTQRQLSIKAGFTETRIGALITRLRKAPESGINADTLGKLAQTLGVSMKWLQNGEGEPFEVSEQDQVLDENQDRPASIDADHHDIRMGDLANWKQLLASAKAMFNAPWWVWLRLEHSYLMLVAEPTVSSVVQHARFIAEHETPPPDGVNALEYWARLNDEKKRRALERLKGR